MIRVEIRGVDELKGYLIDLPRKLDKYLSKGNQEFMENVRDTAKNYAPKDTGALKESITVEKTKMKGKTKQWKVVAHAPYAIFQELGFTPHTFFANPETGFNSSKLPPYRFYTVSKSTPFLVPAIDHQLVNLPKILNAQLNKAIRRAGK